MTQDETAQEPERPREGAQRVSPPREPTLGMLDAGYAALSRIYPPNEHGGNAIGQQIVWESMYAAWVQGW